MSIEEARNLPNTAPPPILTDAPKHRGAPVREYPAPSGVCYGRHCAGRSWAFSHRGGIIPLHRTVR